MEWAIVAKFTGVVLAMLNPIGNLPVYLQETAADAPPVRRHVSLLLTGALAVALVAIFVGGSAVIEFLGISLHAFMIAGGLLLLLYGLQRVYQTERPNAPGEAVAANTPARFRALLVPVCIPLYVGPGTISTVIAYSDTGVSPGTRLAMVGALLVAAAAVGATFLGGGLVKRVLGDTGLQVAGRLMGLVLASVGVDLLLRGLALAMPGIFGG